MHLHEKLFDQVGLLVKFLFELVGHLIDQVLVLLLSHRNLSGVSTRANLTHLATSNSRLQDLNLLFQSFVLLNQPFSSILGLCGLFDCQDEFLVLPFKAILKFGLLLLLSVENLLVLDYAMLQLVYDLRIDLWLGIFALK